MVKSSCLTDMVLTKMVYGGNGLGMHQCIPTSIGPIGHISSSPRPDAARANSECERGEGQTDTSGGQSFIRRDSKRPFPT